MTEMIMNTIITAIAATIGPIAFSTREEKRKASETTTDILKKLKQYAQINRHITSFDANTVIFPLKTKSAPVPKNKIPNPRLINASQKSIEMVAIIPAKNFEVTI